MSRKYASLADFQSSTLGRLKSILKEPGLRIKVRHVHGGGEDAWATAEMRADAECENGTLLFPLPTITTMERVLSWEIAGLRAYQGVECRCTSSYISTEEGYMC